MSRAKRHRRRFAIALVDIDYFKQFNDAHGHAEGDAVLRGLADVLQSCVRESDLVARYGGEEFVLLLPETGGTEARLKLEALRLLVAATTFGDRGGTRGHRITLSAGVAEFPSDGESPARLLGIADERLYEAKRTGRNRVSPASFRPERSARASEPV